MKMSDFVLGFLIGAAGMLFIEFFLILVWAFFAVAGGDDKDE
jgi:hypothetical protein